MWLTSCNHLHFFHCKTCLTLHTIHPCNMRYWGMPLVTSFARWKVNRFFLFHPFWFVPFDLIFAFCWLLLNRQPTYDSNSRAYFSNQEIRMNQFNIQYIGYIQTSNKSIQCLWIFLDKQKSWNGRFKIRFGIKVKHSWRRIIAISEEI